MHGSSDNDRLMTVVEVADYLAVKVSWIHDQWRAKGLPGFKIGNAVRFRRSDVDQWLEGQRVAA